MNEMVSLNLICKQVHKLGIFYLLSSTRQAPLLVIPRTQAAEV